MSILERVRNAVALMDPRVVARAVTFWPHFDRNWYRASYPDVQASRVPPFLHFALFGFKEGRAPSGWISIQAYLAAHPRVSQRGSPPLYGGSRQTSRKYRHAQREIARQYSPARTLVVFFNVARDVIGGGMLSINRFATCALDILQSAPDTQVVVSGVPLGLSAVNHRFFKSVRPQVEFRYLVAETDPDTVYLFLPEAFCVDFAKALDPDSLKWLYSRRKLTIVVMNQNNDLMPHPDVLKESLFPITKNIIISTAHTQYCTDRMAARYGVPVKQLTPILPEVRRRTLAEKERLIMLSPDLMDLGPSGINRDSVVKTLRKELPDFEFVTVEKMSLDEYLDLASRAMFSLTFGEGLDGYLIEPVLGGGVAFAVYRPMFFPQSFEDEPTVFLSWESLMAEMPRMVDRLSKSEEEYAAANQGLRSKLAALYSDERSRSELSALLAGEVDHLPGALADVKENFQNIKEFLEEEHGFRFASLPVGSCSSGGLMAARTPDDLFLLHYGGEFYSVLYEVYVSHDYDVHLRPDNEYILIDIGANFGLVTLYLLNKYPQIRACHAFEPAEPTARLAFKNIECNRGTVPIDLKMIGLSDSFSRKTLEYIPDWSTAFSTDDESLTSYLRDTTSHVDTERPYIEVEVVPAHTELGPIFAARGDRKIVVKCDTQGAEFGILADMAAHSLLKEVDIFVIESHFRDPSELVKILCKDGFRVEKRLDSAANQVYTIYAYRG